MTMNYSNTTSAHLIVAKAAKCSSRRRDKCSDGAIIPFWSLILPIERNHTDWQQNDNDEDPLMANHLIAGHAIAFLIFLVYLLFGANIITNQLVIAADVIASQKRKNVVKLKTGGVRTIQQPIWSQSILLLTVQAFSWASLDIFLPIVEIFSNNFHANQLGISLIIGNSSFQTLVGCGICMLTRPDWSKKRIQEPFIFYLTAIFGVLSYLWVCLFVGQITSGGVDLWEAILQLAFYPGVILAAWAVERNIPDKMVGKIINGKRSTIGGLPPVIREEIRKRHEDVACDYCPVDWPKDEKIRHKLARRLQNLRAILPNRSDEEIEEIAVMELFKDISKRPSLYRLQATILLPGPAGRFQQSFPSSTLKGLNEHDERQTIGFVSKSVQCFESSPVVLVQVERQVSVSQLAATELTFTYMTIEESAKATVNFEPTISCLTIEQGEQQAAIKVKLYDGKTPGKRNSTFSIKLGRPRVYNTASDNTIVAEVIEERAVTTVSIVHDINCGIFAFEKPHYQFASIYERAFIKVVRLSGARGAVTLPYNVRPKKGRNIFDFHLHIPTKGFLYFVNGQVEAVIELEITDRDRRKTEESSLIIELLAPSMNTEQFSRSPKRWNLYADPLLGNPNTCQVDIYDDAKLNDTVDRLIETTDFAEHMKTTSSWKEDLRRAAILPPKNDFSNVPRFLWPAYYVLHIFAMPWQVLVALCPPVSLLYGWPTWLCLNGLMIFVTILIHDCATHFGCTIGLQNAITSITIVTFFWGLPNILATRLAAIKEKTADVALGRLASVNIVTVSLGIGLSWTIGAIASKNEVLKVQQGDHGFNIMIHCVFLAAWTLIMLIRRLPPIGGELAGPTRLLWPTGALFISLWLLWVILSILEKWCIIPGL